MNLFIWLCGFGLRTGFKRAELNAFVFQGAPQALDPAASAIYYRQVIACYHLPVDRMQLVDLGSGLLGRPAIIPAKTVRHIPECRSPPAPHAP